jgi:monoterpene epsilon-lactone hydrolase
MMTVQGIPAEWVIAPNAVEGRVFLYLHGGAYIMGSLNTHRHLAAKLSRSTATKVLLIDYRLTPENPFPAALEDAVKSYRWLVSSGISPEQIVIGGDSAGGGLTLATLLSLRDDGDALPASVVLLSPWTDLEGTGESMESWKEVDPWLSSEATRAIPAMYIHELDPRNPLVSPIYADLGGLPPMLVHVGNDEILLDDRSVLWSVLVLQVLMLVSKFGTICGTFSKRLKFQKHGKRLRKLGITLFKNWKRSFPNRSPIN